METHNADFRYLVPYASSSGAIRRARKRPRAAQPAAQPAANGAPPPLLATPSPSLIPSPSPSPRANARTPRANGLPMPKLMLGVPVAQVNKLEAEPNLMAPTR